LQLDPQDLCEPIVRINTDRIDGDARVRMERDQAWYSEAEFYNETAANH